MTKRTRIAILTACVALAAPPLALAEDVEKRWRVGFSVGGYDGRDQINSDSANVLVITDERDIFESAFVDPRSDDAAISNLALKSTVRTGVTAQYAFNRIFLVELFAGYQKGDVGDVELQAWFDGDPPDPDAIIGVNFRIFRFDAGELEQVPLKVTALARFRPRANLNPFIGIGGGYTFIGFEPSNELDSISANLDTSVGGFSALQSFGFGSPFTPPDEVRDLEKATVNARDTFEWHLMGGVEYTVARKWALFVDLRWNFASRSFGLQFDGADNVGVAVENERVFREDPLASAVFGAMLVTEGGILDGGRLVPEDPDDPVDCAAEPGSCTFVPEPDGVPDTGYYYIQGGQLRYDNVTLQIGFRYTF